MTPHPDIAICQHALGISADKREPYRNRYVAGPGHHAMPAIERLIAAGFMQEAPAPAFLATGDKVYQVTPLGEAEAISCLPRMSRGKRRYKAWLRISDVYQVTFRQFLTSPQWAEARRMADE